MEALGVLVMGGLDLDDLLFLGDHFLAVWDSFNVRG